MRDVTISDITFDGNSSNNLLFTLQSENNLLTFINGDSMLFKDMEIRNAVVVDYMQEIQDVFLLKIARLLMVVRLIDIMSLDL